MKLQNVNRQLTAACRYSYNRLALNYYMFHETETLDERAQRSAAGDLGDRFDGILSGFLDGERPVETLDALRADVILRMEQATAYTDCFQAYEYVLNRLEAKFFPVQDDGGETDQERLAWLMQFIAAPKEAVTVNERIQTVLSQLPVRLTRQRFFALVKEGLEVYAGASRKSVEDMFYVLRSEALLNLPPGMAEAYPDLAALLERFEGADYREMTAESYRELAGLLQESGELLADYSGGLMLLMDMVNDLYVVLLARPGAMMDVAEEGRLGEVLRTTAQCAAAGVNADEAILRPLEGRQETCYEQWEASASPLDLLEELAEQDPVAETLRKIGLLLSSSSFMPLQLKKQGGETVKRDELELMEDALFAQMTEAFSGRPRLVVRALMAKVLSGLPVFFGSLEDVQDYIRGALDSCADETEKTVCMRLIRQLAGQQTV